MDDKDLRQNTPDVTESKNADASADIADVKPDSPDTNINTDDIKPDSPDANIDTDDAKPDSKDGTNDVSDAYADDSSLKETGTDLSVPEFKFLGDPNIDGKDKTKKITLFKRLKPIIVLCAVAVILVGSVFALKFVFPQEEEPSDIDENSTGIQIFDFIGSSADRMEIKNTNDSYAFVKKVEKTFVIEGKEDLPVINSSIIAAMSTFGSLTADSEVATGVTDFEQYGLNDPVSTVTWKKDDQTHYIELGTLASSGGYYMRVDGGDTVYTYDSINAKYYLSPRMDYYSTAVFDFNEEQDASYINHFLIKQRDSDPIEIQLQDLTDESLDSAYLIVKPVTHNFSVEKSYQLTQLMKNLTSCTVYDDDISPENLKKYGLDDPQYTFSFTNVQVVNTAYFGDLSDEGYYYMYADDHDFIYIVDADTINVITHDVAYYCEGMSYIRSYDTIDNLTINGAGKTYFIDITGTADTNDLKAYINNKYVEYDSFADLYGHLISIEIKDTGEKRPDDELLVTITVNCIDGTTDVLKYYKQSDVDSFFELNGEGIFIVSTSKVEQILEFAQKLYDGEEIPVDW